MATPEETKQLSILCLAIVLCVWGVAWGIVAYNRSFLENGYSQVAVPGVSGTVWQRQTPKQLEQGGDDGGKTK